MDSPTPLEATDKKTHLLSHSVIQAQIHSSTHTAKKLEIRFFLDRLLNRSLSAEFGVM